MADSGNPLAIPMSLRVDWPAARTARAGELAASVPRAGSKLLVLVHGLCMSDRQWARAGHDHGQVLADEFGYTPLYLHYNSGRHVSQNGREFAALLERLVTQWPVPVQELVILGHSMGGLVTRSACHHAAQSRHAWLARLKSLVFLGTPHHGAPLERGGRRVDVLLGLSPYVAPFARLGKARSAGITDLRYGNLQDADWQGRDRHAQQHDDRQPTPLPDGVAAYLVAATTAERAGGLHGKLIGDGLVPVASALGEHRDPALALSVPKSQQHIVTSCGHLDLLCRDEVHAQLRRWLGRGSTRPAATASGQRAPDLREAAGDLRDVDGRAELALDLRARDHAAHALRRLRGVASCTTSRWLRPRRLSVATTLPTLAVRMRSKSMASSIDSGVMTSATHSSSWCTLRSDTMRMARSPRRSVLVIRPSSEGMSLTTKSMRTPW